MLGPTIESESITKFDPIFSLDQTYFESFSTFSQDIQIEKNISYLNAKIYFQACDDGKLGITQTIGPGYKVMSKVILISFDRNATFTHSHAYVDFWKTENVTFS